MSARLLPALLLLALRLTTSAAPIPESPNNWLANYFTTETARLEAACLSTPLDAPSSEPEIATLRQQFREMLGLWPTPAKTDLNPVVTGRIEHETFVVESLHFQSIPGLYVTANLYLPRNIDHKVPAILYACGHANVVTNGIHCGNKTYYQHHGIWFARHNTACLVIDSVQLGEIPGLHHGTYREGMWWWNARGYTPAGVEAWNCIRALDYLETRPEVDPTRFGMTGRSGGGSYTWTTAALDTRVRVAAPVAGITDLRNQVLDGCVQGHCDCMFFINTYQWDFPQLANLIAPRPLLIVNTDSDSIFPLDGVVRTHNKARIAYSAHKASEHLGLVIAPGEHKDTQDLQIPVFRWMNQYLHQKDPLIQMAAERLLNPLKLRAFTNAPPPSINATIHESFVPALKPDANTPVLDQVRRLSFGGWPQTEAPLKLQERAKTPHLSLRLRVFEFESQPDVTLQLFIAEPTSDRPVSTTTLHILDETSWPEWYHQTGEAFSGTSPTNTDPKPSTGPASIPPDLATSITQNHERHIWLAPRGIGPTAWTATPQQEIHLRRRFMLLGQTLDGMRVYDIQRATQATHELDSTSPLTLTAEGIMGINTLYAALLHPTHPKLELTDLPQSHRIGPDYLNILRILDIPQALSLAQDLLQPKIESPAQQPNARHQGSNTP